MLRLLLEVDHGNVDDVTNGPTVPTAMGLRSSSADPPVRIRVALILGRAVPEGTPLA
jgi:hypothetical protein